MHGVYFIFSVLQSLQPVEAKREMIVNVLRDRKKMDTSSPAMGCRPVGSAQRRQSGDNQLYSCTRYSLSSHKSQLKGDRSVGLKIRLLSSNPRHCFDFDARVNRRCLRPLITVPQNFLLDSSLPSKSRCLLRDRALASRLSRNLFSIGTCSYTLAATPVTLHEGIKHLLGQFPVS